MQTESIPVGRNMIVGYQWTTQLISEGKVVSSSTRDLAISPGSSTGGGDAMVGEFPIDTFPVPDKHYTVETQFTVFETDIPLQFMWSPSSGQYKVLRTGIVRAEAE